MEIRIVDRIDLVGERDWNALVRDDDSPFVRYEWLHALEEAKCVGPKSGWHPLHLCAYDGDTLVAAAPAYVKENSEGEFVYDWSWAEASQRMGVPYYPKLVVAVPFTPASGARVLALDPALRAALVPAFAEAADTIAGRAGLSGVHVLFPRGPEVETWGETAYGHRVAIQYQWFNNHYDSFEAFLAKLPSKKRTQLRRECGQAAKDGVTLRTLAADEHALHAKTFYELYLTTVDRYTWGRRYLNARFFELVSDRFRDRLAWVAAEREGKVVAGAFNVEGGNVLYGRYWGAFVDLPFLHFNVCYYHGIKDCIAKGYARFEPGAGGEHKRIRGFVPTITHSFHAIRDARFRRAVTAFLAEEREAVRAHVAEARAESTVAPDHE